jgi:hypothetical protein
VTLDMFKSLVRPALFFSTLRNLLNQRGAGPSLQPNAGVAMANFMWGDSEADNHRAQADALVWALFQGGLLSLTLEDRRLQLDRESRRFVIKLLKVIDTLCTRVFIHADLSAVEDWSMFRGDRARIADFLNRALQIGWVGWGNHPGPVYLPTKNLVRSFLATVENEGKMPTDVHN